MIRPFETADLPALATLHAVSRRHAYADLLPAGALDDAPPWDGRATAIHEHPDHRRSGAATALHDEILGIMRAAGCGLSILWVVAGDQAGAGVLPP